MIQKSKLLSVGASILAFASSIFAPNAVRAEIKPGHPSGVASYSGKPSTTVLKKLGELGPSFYWVAVEAEDGLPRMISLKDASGGELLKVSEKFFKDLKMEGTGKLLDGRIVNFDMRVTLPDGTKEIRWIICPPEVTHGYGLDRRPLIPFKSLAVDPNVVPMDSVLYIPQAKGARLPDGTIHDGYFHAIDIGDAIKSERIDVFTSIGDQSSVFSRNGLIHGKKVEVFILKEE